MIGKDTLFELAKALEGVPIVGCLQGSPAALAGVRYGDVLLSVNGMRTRNVLDYLEAKGLRTDGMTAVVFRAGAERPVELEYRQEGAAVDVAALLAELVSLRLVPSDLGDGGQAS